MGHFLPFRRVFPVLLVLTIGAALGQRNDDPRAALPESIKQGPGMDKIPFKAEDQENHEQVKKMFEMRQAEIRRDTEKLFQASSELRQYVNKSSSNVLSVDMIKKAETIEKLARSVKQRMKESQ